MKLLLEIEIPYWVSNADVTYLFDNCDAFDRLIGPIDHIRHRGIDGIDPYRRLHDRRISAHHFLIDARLKSVHK